MQSLLGMLPVGQLDNVRSKLVWKAYIALILLFAERGQDISGVSNPLLDAVDAAVVQPDNLDLMRIFADGFQDLMDSTNNLELGQYIFIG